MNELNETNPYVSIIIATYNREKLLKEAVDSVLSQTYNNYELIIIDDGSNDNTQALIENYNNIRIRYIYQKNKGRSAARNNGLNLAKGRYITFLDSDDLYLADKLKLQVDYLDSHPNVGMIYTSAFCIDENGNRLSHDYHATVSGALYKKIAFFIPVTITLPTVMVRKEIIAKVGNFDERMYRFEDTDYWRRISKITRIDAISKPTCKLRTHQDNQLISQNPDEIYKAIHYYAKKILKEDKEISWIIRYRGIGCLYHHYAIAFLRVPHLQKHGRKLLNLAYKYWPLCKFRGIKYRLKNMLKNFFEFSLK